MDISGKELDVEGGEESGEGGVCGDGGGAEEDCDFAAVLGKRVRG